MFKNTLGLRRKGDPESAQEIFQLYNTRELQKKTVRKSQRGTSPVSASQSSPDSSSHMNNPSRGLSYKYDENVDPQTQNFNGNGNFAEDTSSMQSTSPRGSSKYINLSLPRMGGSSGGAGASKTRFNLNGGLETVNLKHRPNSSDKSKKNGQSQARTLPRAFKNTARLMKSLSFTGDEEPDIDDAPLNPVSARPARARKTAPPLPVPISLDGRGAEVDDGDGGNEINPLKGLLNSSKSSSPEQRRPMHSRTYSDTSSTGNISQMGLSVGKASEHSKGDSSSNLGGAADKVNSITSQITANLKLPKTISEIKNKYMSAIYARSEQFKDKETAFDENGEEISGSSKKKTMRGLGKADFAFKQAMLDKFGVAGVTGPNFARKNSSFNSESTKILLIGPAKSGKSTIYKELLSLAGFPPNFARAYIPTRDPVEKDVTIENEEFQLIDIGGDKKEIVKWRFYLSSADLILFVVALDEYDRVDKSTGVNCLEEAIELFEGIINNISVMNSKMILVLNKADRFKKKLCEKNIPLGEKGNFGIKPKPDCFDFEEGVEWVKSLFVQKMEECDQLQDIKVEVLNATDGEATIDFAKRMTSNTAQSHKANKWRNLL